MNTLQHAFTRTFRTGDATPLEQLYVWAICAAPFIAMILIFGKLK